ncbi:MAG: hypothetical protein ACO207_01025 [Bacilli bacterium]
MKLNTFTLSPILENPTLAIVTGIFLVIAFFSTIFFFIVFNNQYKKHQLAIQQRIHHYLVYRINLKLDVVYEFDPKHPGKEKIIQLSQFLKKFTAVESEKIYQWWEKLLTAKLDTSWILTSKSAKKKIYNQIIFEVVKIDEIKQTIHLHQYGLKYLKPNPKKAILKSLVISSQQALDVIKKLPTKNGALISIFMMFPRSGLDEQFKYFYLSQIKEKLIPYLSINTLLIDSANDILVLVTKAAETYEYMQIAQGLYQVISQYVEVNALEALIKFNVAIIEHKHFPNDFRTLMRKSRELNQLMIKRKLSILPYETNQPIVQALETNESLFVEDVYHQLKFSLNFRPLILPNDLKVFGQQVMIQTQIQSPLTTLELLQDANDLMTYTKDFYRRYLYLIGQVVLPSLEQKILVPFSLVIKPNEYINEIKNLPNAQNIVLILDEVEVKEFAATEVSLKAWAEPLQRQGIKFALAIDDAITNLPDEIYQYFQYYFLNYKRIVNVENSQKTSIQLKLIFQNLSKFNKPFVITDLLSEGSLELLPLKHVKIMSADWIMGYQTSPDQPSKRSYSKLKNLISKQEQYYGKTN